jgi:hypothetical protein
MITAVVVLLIYVLFTVENSLDVKEVFGTFYYKFIAVALAKVRGFEMLLIMYVYVENGTSRECAISTAAIWIYIPSSHWMLMQLFPSAVEISLSALTETRRSP